MQRWKLIEGFDYDYKVSDSGDVYTPCRDRLLKGRVDKDGYRLVALRKNGRSVDVRVHRAVGEAFIPNPEKHPLIRHKNNITNDNRVENLTWGTHWDNIADRNGFVEHSGRSNVCARGHPLVEGNIGPNGRRCLACLRAANAIRSRRIQGGVNITRGAQSLADIYYHAALSGHNFSSRTYDIESVIEQYQDQAEAWRKGAA